MKFKDLLSGFIRLHVLHHAAEHEIYGQWMIDELARHGYKCTLGAESEERDCADRCNSRVARPRIWKTSTGNRGLRPCRQSSPAVA